MPTVTAIIGGNIRIARARRNFTQKDLARILGFSDGTIAQIELGRRVITVDDLIPLCAALDVDLTVLLEGLDAGDKIRLGMEVVWVQARLTVDQHRAIRDAARREGIEDLAEAIAILATRAALG